jgi:flagellar biosynthetic protein FlhB
VAFDNAPERTEQATPRRREDARKEGRYAYSAELVGGIMILSAICALLLFGGSMGSGLLEVFRGSFEIKNPTSEFDLRKVSEIASNSFSQFLNLVGPIFAVLVAAALASNIAQVGWFLTPQKLEPDFNRINPAQGWQRLMSLSTLFKAIASLCKVAVLVAAVYFVMRSRTGQLTNLGREKFAGATETAWSLVLRTSLAMAGVLLLFGLIDYFRERRKFESSIKMTRQEIRDEIRQEEGDPTVKRRIRQLQRERSNVKMLQAVPRATVVVTNPTHFAVALQYTAGGKAAPKVVAKGTGAVALRIADIARRHGVAVMERPAVARALYRVVPVNGEIPMEMFRVVAEIIATVLRLRGIT